MATTTILKLADALKARIAELASSAGKTLHAFMVEALEAETRRSELLRDFVNTALKAEQEVAKYGEVFAMDAMHRYFSDKLARKTVRRPNATKLDNVTASSIRER